MAAKTSTYPAKRRALDEDIRQKTFRRSYLIHGEEAYLRDQCRTNLLNAITDGLNDMNINRFTGDNLREEEVIDLAETLPFFADFRLIILEDTGLFKTGEHPLADYLKDAADTVRFVFIERDADKRSKLYKAIEKDGLTIECDTPTEKDIFTWIGVRCKKAGKKITQGAAVRLLESVGLNMQMLVQEADKLIDYTEGRDAVTEADVEAVCAKNITGQIYEMTDAIADGDRERALQLYYDLLALKESSQRILALIARQFNLMLQIKEMKALHQPAQMIAETVGLPPFVVRKYEGWAARFDKERLRGILQACIEQDEAVKTGRLNDKISVEMLILQATSVAA